MDKIIIANENTRFDAIQEPKWMSSIFTDTPEGYLKGRAILTNVGVFTYRDSDGNTIRDLRLPEEVFAKDTLDSLRMLPVTLDHPAGLLTVENVKEHQVGYTGDTPSSVRDPESMHITASDGLHVSNEIVITDKEAIQLIKAGKRGLSCGYVCDLEKADVGARWCGVPYDFIQRNIRYNHVAVCEVGRAGDAARIRFDSVEAIHNSIREEVPMNLKTVVLDGVEYQAEAEVLKALNQNKEEVESVKVDAEKMKDQLSLVEAERDTFKDENTRLQAEIEELKNKKMDESEIQARVKSLVRVQSVAEKLGVEVKADMSESEIMKAAIVAKYPKAVLDGKDDVYVRARFDSVAEVMDEEADRETRVVGAPVLDGGDVVRADDARKRMIEEQRRLSREKLGQ
jgi:uncharacterized protein